MMGRFASAVGSKRVNIALFAVAVILLLISAVGGTRAALSYYSDTYLARLAVSDIGVTLLENGEEVAWRNYEGNDAWSTPQTEEAQRLLQGLLPAGEQFQIGRAYPEQLQVQNTGQISQYVRVKLYKYWEDAEGNKTNVVAPDLIKLELADGSGWMVDQADSTDERTVLYFTRVLEAGATTPSLTSSVSVDPVVVRLVTEEKVEENGTIITKYDYKGLRFCIEAEVDAIQEHNISDAALSAWGKNLSANNGELSLG